MLQYVWAGVGHVSSSMVGTSVRLRFALSTNLYSAIHAAARLTA